MTPIDNTLPPGNGGPARPSGPEFDDSLAGSPLDLAPDTSNAAAVHAGDHLINFISTKPMTALLASIAVGAGTMALVKFGSRSSLRSVARSPAPLPVGHSKSVWPSLVAGILGAWLG